MRLSIVKQASVVVLTISASAVWAQGISYTGGLSGVNPTFNRPVENGTSAPTSLSSLGTSVYYNVQPFYVNTTGGYNFLVTPSPTFDSYLILYRNSFNPASPLTNCIAANDDFNSLDDSGFASFALTAGIQYYAVTSTYDNKITGLFSSAIGTTTRPTGSTVFLGNVVVPESGNMVLIGTGILPLVGIVSRRRRK